MPIISYQTMKHMRDLRDSYLEIRDIFIRKGLIDPPEEGDEDPKIYSQVDYTSERGKR